MIVSPLTLLINGALVLFGIILTLILLRISARHEYHYGMSDVQGPLRRWMIIILFIILFMSFAAGVYNLLFPWLLAV